MAERGGVKVKGDAEGVGFLLFPQPQQRGKKTEHRVSVQSVPGSQGPDAVIGPVQNAVAVDDHELHGTFLLPALRR